MFLFSLLLQKLVPVLMSVFSTNISSWYRFLVLILVLSTGWFANYCMCFWLFSIRPACTCFLRVWVKFCKSARFIKHRSRNRPYLNFCHWSMSVVTLADQLLCTFQRKTGALIAIKIFSMFYTWKNGYGCYFVHFTKGEKWVKWFEKTFF